jgi:predicted CDP-diglyceride synthetase/phosphatidate cytidylyltransferase
MMYLPWRIRPPTGSEQTVLFWGIVVLLIGFGAVCLFFGYRAPAEKADEAAQAIRGGWGFIGVGVAMYLVRRFFCGFSD